jgi:hypothetical protein
VLRLALFLISCLVLLLRFLPASALELDHHVEWGKRVDGIGRYTSLSILRTLYRPQQLRHRRPAASNGELYDVTDILSNTGYSMTLIWEPDAVHQLIKEVQLTGRKWLLPNGLKLGLPLSEITAINNGQTFSLHGFYGSTSGKAVFSHGPLAHPLLTLHCAPLEKNYPLRLNSSDLFRSDDFDLRNAQTIISRIDLRFTPPPPAAPAANTAPAR